MLEPAYTIVAALSCGAPVTEQAITLLPDLIILDISLGDISGFEVARRLKRAGCAAKIIFLSLHEDMDFVGAAFGLGASGFVFKSRLSTDLENAIAAVSVEGNSAPSVDIRSKGPQLKSPPSTCHPERL